MSDHIPEASKMVSDTPRTDAAYFRPHATMYDLAGEMKRMERELNAANERIDELKYIIDRAANRFFCDGSDGQTAAEMLVILEEMHKAKP